MTADDAAALLWVLTGFDAFDLLRTGKGLSVDETARTLIEAAERALTTS